MQAPGILCKHPVSGYVKEKKKICERAAFPSAFLEEQKHH